jgi:opacity protein-like surface antigen
MYVKTKLSRKESLLSKLTIGTILLLFTLLVGILDYALAQGVSPYFGMGSATNSAGTSPGCPSGFLFDALTGNCEPGPTIGGVFGVFGVDFMIKPHLGINGEYAFRFAQADYLPAAGLTFRPGFYDFNAVWEPVPGKRVVPILEGGIGGARVALYVTQQCSITGINCTATYPAGINANHFQLHAGLGVKLYVHGNIFVKPQFDFHYAIHLTDQFGRNAVPQYTVAFGYTFGEH